MDIAKQVESQRIFFSGGTTKAYIFRLNALKRLRTSILAHRELIMKALWQDLRKSEFESYATEITMILGELDLAIKSLRGWMRDQKRPTSLILFPAKSRIIQEPYGVVLIVSPWNYPFQLTFSPLIGSIAAGNCAILKPSTAATATADVMAKIISETFDSTYISLINGGNELTDALLHEHFDYIFYTGGASYGKVVMRAAAENLTPITMELGGKSPCIVERDANLQIAARRIVWGKFLNCGQTCVAPDFLMVHNSVKPQLIEHLKREIARQFGTDIKSSPDYPRIINDSRFVRLALLMSQGRVISGGEMDSAERFMAPTLLDNIKMDSDLMGEEIFGPLLPIIGFDDLEWAIEYINSHQKPLALYCFTQSGSKAEHIIRNTSSGGVCINDVVIQVANPHIPFGGVGNSGFGSYHGRYSFLTFSHSRSVMSCSTKINIGIKFAPYKNKIRLLKKL